MHGATEYMLTFLLVGTVLTALAAAVGGAAWVLLWPGLVFLLVAVAYMGLGPRLLGKRADGTIAWPARLLLGPYLLANWVLWRVHQLLLPGPRWVEVLPGLWMGARPCRDDLPGGASLVVDLTAEFAESKRALAGRAYRCLPTLDASAPAEGPFLELVAEVAAWQAGVYVHCANGRGRSAAVVAGVLMARGLADDADGAIALLKKARPGVNLSKAQRRLLARAAGELATSPGAPGLDAGEI